MIWDNPSQLATQHSEVQILLIIPSFYGESRGWLINWSAIAGQILWMQMPRWSFAYEMAVRDKHCERKELKQDWAEGEVKMQCRPHKAGREFWSKNCLIVLPSNCNGLVFITTLPHTHISHNHQWCAVFCRAWPQLRLTLKELTTSGYFLLHSPQLGSKTFLEGQMEQHKKLMWTIKEFNVPWFCCSDTDFFYHKWSWHKNHCISLFNSHMTECVLN